MKILKSSLLVIIIAALTGCATAQTDVGTYSSGTIGSISEVVKNENSEEVSIDVNSTYTPDDGLYIEILNDNRATFTEDEITDKSYEFYSDLDELGRCGVAEACIGIDIMPTEEREGIGNVKPTGWQTVKYDSVSGKYLYNRCHLIGFQLAGENANPKNLITGTRYLNVTGMLPYENMVADYVKETGNHVMYRVTPVFEDDELVARGVIMEALSVEDDEIEFNVMCYNKQPGIEIDYSTGKSKEVGAETEPEPEREYTKEERGTEDYVVNTNSKKFHNPDCSSLTNTKEENKEIFNGPRQWLIDNGYEACGKCKP